MHLRSSIVVVDPVHVYCMCVGSRGLLDPCEKDPVDAAAYLTATERSSITLSAQVCMCVWVHVCIQ